MRRSDPLPARGGGPSTGLQPGLEQRLGGPRAGREARRSVGNRAVLERPAGLGRVPRRGGALGLPQALLCLCLLLIAAPAIERAHASQQSDAGSFREEQDLLLRQLVRLRQTMELLLARMEKEGSTRTAELLREALANLDAREAQNRTLEEWMKESASSLDSGLVLRAVEQQQAAIGELEKLLTILLDRGATPDLEKRLEDLASIQAKLKGLTDAERELEKRIQALEDQARDPASVALEQRLTELAERQRALAEETRSAARASADFEFEWLLRELGELEQRAARDRERLSGLDGEQTALLGTAQQRLLGARSAEGAALRPAEAARELSAAAERLRGGADPAIEAARLAELAKAAAKAAETAPDEARAAAARAAGAALERAQAALSGLGAEAPPAAREAAAAALETEASQLAARARERGAEAEAERRAADAALAALEAPAGSDLARAAAQARAALADAAEAQAERAAGTDPASAAEQGQRALSATERAMRSVDGARAADSSQRSEALRSSQAAAQGAKRLSKLLGELAEKNRQEAGADPALDGALGSARDELDAAAAQSEAASGALEQAAREPAPQSEASLESARAANAEGAARLGQARQALEAARAGAGQSSKDRQALAPLEARQAELSREASGLESPSGRSNPGLEQAIEQAREAMRSAQTSLSEGRGQSAAGAQQQALEALEAARQAAAQPAGPLGAEAAAEAQRLAEEQRRLREQILELAKLNAEREEAQPTPGLEGAAAEAERSADSLERGDAEAGAEQAENTVRELEAAQAELSEEERRYQQLRQEELLVEIGTEARALLDEHRQQIEALRGLDERRTPGEAPSRSVRLGLRRVAQVEEQLGQRSGKLAADLEAESALVFAEYFRAVETDLAVIARDVGEAGDYQSGERILSMQLDVADRLVAVIEALEQERERREREQQQQQQQEQPQGQQPPEENRLVPDVAELKLLRRMQVDVQQSLEQLAGLIEGSAEVDPLWLSDIQRVAGRHERLTQLFSKFRERLGLPDPDAAQSPTAR
jgi:hypothetical protein